MARDNENTFLSALVSFFWALSSFFKDLISAAVDVASKEAPAPCAWWSYWMMNETKN